MTEQGFSSAYGLGVTERDPLRRPESWPDRAVRFLTRQPSTNLFVGFLVCFLTGSLAGTFVLDAVISREGEEQIATLAAPLMPVLGGLFAFLTAFAINTEWNQLRDAQQSLDHEADAAARLAWIADTPGLDGLALRDSLRSYLRLVIAEEWPGLERGFGSKTARNALASLGKQARRSVSAGPDVAPPLAADLLDATDELAGYRRDRLSLAARNIPPALLLLVLSSGVFVCLDAILLALHHQAWIAAAISGLVVIVALDLALVVAVTAPYQGPITVDPSPLLGVLEEIDRGVFGSVGEGQAGDDQAPEVARS
ncbi:MAG: hypothetical protein JJLCMIEE_01717 [Acidimicrobiales bacterium]|nr:MAG: DUF4239 domain-containing protein [Actinomycetota bacterium]MBV6508652.1 hypothetical protein [Acidimicrobiales bacterium]RIK08096.1 MAG: hypothetical protein DCC48_01545 [Acidobacteriota bacterium]